MFPRGRDGGSHLAAFLNVADAHLQPPGWRRHASFEIHVLNVNAKLSITKGASAPAQLRQLVSLYDASATPSVCTASRAAPLDK